MRVLGKGGLQLLEVGGGVRRLPPGALGPHHLGARRRRRARRALIPFLGRRGAAAAAAQRFRA
uniref:Uncharacterized protein n=1 Tax=Triticum urartu TaxID=4572 RepID=A0A8R7PVP6_TRIUA